MLWRLAVVMDEVKLAVQASKFMGSEGFGSGGGGGGLGVTVTEVEARESDRISIVVASSIGRYSSALGKKGGHFPSQLRDYSNLIKEVSVIYVFALFLIWVFNFQKTWYSLFFCFPVSGIRDNSHLKILIFTGL